MSGAGRACPTLRTERLTLRAHTPADHAASLAMWSNAEVVRHIGGTPLGAEDVWRRLLSYAGMWSMLGHGYWLVEETTSGRFLGEAGLTEFRRALGPRFDGTPETGWTLVPAAQGRGYAFEAVSAILAWIETTLGAARTVCLIAPENAPSLRLAARLGYREFERAPYRGNESVLLERGAVSSELLGPKT
jgi:RimJ/RimL family protein N-acetyltransferase